MLELVRPPRTENGCFSWSSPIQCKHTQCGRFLHKMSELSGSAQTPARLDQSFKQFFFYRSLGWSVSADLCPKPEKILQGSPTCYSLGKLIFKLFPWSMPGMGSDFTSWMKVLLDTYAVQCLSVCTGKGSMLDSLPPHLIFKLLTISSHGSNATSVPQGPLSGASNLLKCTLCVYSLYRSCQARRERFLSWQVLDTILLDCLHYESVKILWSHFMERKILLLGIRSLNDDVLSISNFSLCY